MVNRRAASIFYALALEVKPCSVSQMRQLSFYIFCFFVVGGLIAVLLHQTRLQMRARVLGQIAESAYYCQLDISAFEHFTRPYSQDAAQSTAFQLYMAEGQINARKAISSLKDGHLPDYCSKISQLAKKAGIIARPQSITD